MTFLYFTLILSIGLFSWLTGKYLAARRFKMSGLSACVSIGSVVGLLCVVAL